MSLTTCNSCGYPHEGGHCDNPACFANPRVSDERKAEWRAEAERARIEREERGKLATLRARAWRQTVAKNDHDPYGLDCPCLAINGE